MQFNIYSSFFLATTVMCLNAQQPEDIINSFLRLKRQHQELKLKLKDDISNTICSIKLEKTKHKLAQHQTIALHRSCFAYFAMLTLFFLNTPFMHIKTAQRKQLQIVSGSIASAFGVSSIATYLSIHLGQQNTTKKLTKISNTYDDIFIRNIP